MQLYKWKEIKIIQELHYHKLLFQYLILEDTTVCTLKHSFTKMLQAC